MLVRLDDRAEESPRRHYILTVPVYDTYIQRGKPTGTSGAWGPQLHTTQASARYGYEMKAAWRGRRGYGYGCVWLKGAITGVSSECDVVRERSEKLVLVLR